MASVSHLEREPRLQGAAKASDHLGARLRRAMGLHRVMRGMRARPPLAERFAPVRRLAETALNIGVRDALPVGTQKRIRLCNLMAIGGAVIMGLWAYIEASFGEH